VRALIVVAVVVSSTLPGCLIDRSALAGDGADAGASLDARVIDARPPDAALPDAPGLDAPFDDAAPEPIDAAVVAEDVFFVMPDAGPVPPDAGGRDAGPCDSTRGPETCNARDDDCDGNVDESICGGSFAGVTVSCASFLYAGHVYQLCRTTGLTMPWEGALMACRGFPPYDLVRIDDNMENSAISSRVVDGDAWLGLNDRAAEGAFEWTDGAALAFESWAASEPSSRTASGGGQDCVSMRPRTPVWDDRFCGVLDFDPMTPVSMFVCEAPILR
jgi:hypothetical protein